MRTISKDRKTHAETIGKIGIGDIRDMVMITKTDSVCI
jgi:hypothetical protein